MPKINQEEYEILKKKQRKGHKYIAREKEGHIIVFTAYHGKSEYRWLVTINEDDLKYESLFNSSKVFQFIKWEDEEPYNISELIEEYLYDNRPKLFIDGQEQSFEFIEESEETEVKKDTEWLKREIHKELEDWHGVEGGIDGDGINEIMLLINQLDEPEVLSLEWISDNAVVGQYPDGMGYVVPAYKLQNLLVPKQFRDEFNSVLQTLPISSDELLSEFKSFVASGGIKLKQEDMFNGQTPEEGEVYFAVGFDGAVEISVARSIDEAIETLTEYGTNYTIIEKPVIPQFVADYIEKQKEFGYSFLLAYEVISDSNKRHEADEKLVDYIQKNQDDFVRAWYGYEIEQEPKYRIKAGDNYLYFNLDGTVRGSTKKNAVISKERLEKLPFDVEKAVESGIIKVEELEE